MANWKKLGISIIVVGLAFFVGYEGIPYLTTKIEELKMKKNFHKKKSKQNN